MACVVWRRCEADDHPLAVSRGGGTTARPPGALASPVPALSSDGRAPRGDPVPLVGAPAAQSDADRHQTRSAHVAGCTSGASPGATSAIATPRGPAFLILAEHQGTFSRGCPI